MVFYFKVSTRKVEEEIKEHTGGRWWSFQIKHDNALYKYFEKWSVKLKGIKFFGKPGHTHLKYGN